MNEQKLKSYWNRPGGVFGIIVAALGLGALLYYVVPILTAMVWNTVNFGIACLAAAVLWYCLSNRTLRLSAMYFYEILMKKLVGVVIQMDPFIIAEGNIKDMITDREKVGEEVNRVEGYKEKLVLKLSEREAQKVRAFSKAEAAKTAGNKMAMAVAAADAARCDEYIKKLTPMKETLRVLGERLDKFYDNGKYVIEDAQSKLEIEKDAYNTVTLGKSAMASALRFMKGDPEKRMLAEQSMDNLRQDIGDKLAYMKRGIRLTTEMVDSIDLENATLEQQGLRLLEEYTNVQNFQVGQAAQAMPVPLAHTTHTSLLD